MDSIVLAHMKEYHVGIKLLRTANFPFIASFLWKSFPGSNRRVLDSETLSAALDDFEFQHAVEHGTERSTDYLKSWVDNGYLRQYYVDTDDLARYELTPSVEKTLDWLYSLKPRGFVGTESRLKTIFELLEDLREKTEKNIQKRVELLQAERNKIDQAISKVLAGDISILSDLQIRERVVQLEDMARQLLRDFSEVEQNFRGLDLSMRQRIATLEGSRGEVLHSVFEANDQIQQSEQGRSFAAFWEFLMSDTRQTQLEQLIDYLYGLDSVQQTRLDPFLASLQSQLLDASDKVRTTQNQLSAQLRRFLDERSRLENTRINRLIKNLEQEILADKDRLATENFSASLDDLSADINIPTRTLHRIPLTLEKQSQIVEANDRQISASALFAIDVIDDRILWARIRKCLERRSPVSLAEILSDFPLEKGIAELIAYIRIASKSNKAAIDEADKFHVSIATATGHRRVTVPYILFSR